MKCHYCQLETTLFLTGNRSPNPSQREKGWMCPECHVAYHFVDGILDYIDLYGFKIRDKKYTIQLRMKENRTILMVQNKLNELYETFDYLDQIVDWTPKNVREKLKNLLPFL